MELSRLPVEAVIFDLDGTLAHFNLDFKTMRGEVRSYLIHMGVPASVLSVNESIFNMLNKVEIYKKNNAKTNHKNLESLEELRNGALSIAEKYELEAAATTSLLPGAIEVLKELKGMGIKLALCTTSSEKASSKVLRGFKIDGFFEVAVSRNQVKRVKPSTEQYEAALAAIKATPQTAVIVGDSVVDMQSAKELKVIAVGVPTGMSTIEQLEQNGANYIITTLSDLPALISEINRA